MVAEELLNVATMCIQSSLGVKEALAKLSFAATSVIIFCPGFTSSSYPSGLFQNDFFDTILL